MIVQTKYGKLRGRERDHFYEFLGIPFAKPPIGELRWRAPQEPEPWDGVRDALEFSAISLQAPSQAIPGNDPTEGLYDLRQDEDCLYMNIWTPALDENAKLPVFLWFHGGACCCGSANGRNASPEPFVKRGIVFVNMNYRLGIMGYFAHPELSAESPYGASGNYAHLDQVAAIDWLRENIRAFGGDPDHIVVGGCSAGAISSQAMACSPLTEGKIVGAIIESGLGMDPTSYPEEYKVDTLEELEAAGVEFMESLGKHSVAELRAMRYEELIQNPETHFRRRLHYGVSLGICGDGYLLPRPSNECTMRLMNHNIPYILGTTKDEAGGFALFIDVDLFRKQTEDLFGEEGVSLCERFGMETKEQVAKLMHDMHTGHCAEKAFAELQAEYGREPVYVFSFSHKSPRTGSAHHGLETQYILGRQQEIPGATALDDEIAENVQEYWCNFIKYGNPNGENGSGICDARPEWRPYSASERNVLDIGDTMKACPEDENELQQFVRSAAVKACKKVCEEEK